MAGIEQIKHLVKNHCVPNIVALGGSEQALLDESLALLRQEVLGESNDGLNHHSYTVGESLPDSWLSSVKTAPFLAARRLIEIHGADKLDAHDVSELIEYISNPADFSVLIIIFHKLDKRNKLVQALEQQKILIEFSAATHNEIVALVKYELEKYKMSSREEAINLLIVLLDNDLIAIKAALEKMSLVLEHQELSLDHIAEHIVDAQMPDVFRLARFMSEGDLKASLQTLGMLRQAQENAIKFLGVLIWQFRVLVHIRSCLDQGMQEWDIRKAVSVYGERFVWMLKVAKKRTITFHINRLTKLIQCDVALKSQKISEPLTLIEKVVYQSAVGA